MVNIEAFGQQVKTDKWIHNLLNDMSKIVPYLDNPKVTDIAIGIGGQLIVEGLGMDKTFTGIYFSDEETKSIIHTSAAILNVNIDQSNPTVEGVLPLPKWKIRVEGILPPRAAENPLFVIRRSGDTVFSLESYLDEKRITKDKYDLLVKHIKKRSNIVIGGETGSGKTKLLNAIIDKIVEFTPDDRFYIVEDASEIKCHAKDLFPIWAAGKDCLKAVGTAMRCNVSRIIFGELRYGDVTNELLKAWNSGHTGGITTVHANSALTMISRIRDLLREVIPGELPDVAQSVQLLVHMIPTKNGPIVNEVVETSQMSGSSFIEELESNNLI